MIEFVTYRETSTQDEKEWITEALKSCNDPNTFCHMINIVYNNTSHMQNLQHDMNIETFLRELQNVVNNSHNTIRVMGTVHHDASAHPSGIIGQYDDHHNFHRARAIDSYIRFQVVMNPKHIYAYQVLNTTQIFHFLIAPPHIQYLSLPKKFPTYVYMYNTQNQPIDIPGIYPTSDFQNNKVIADTSILPSDSDAYFGGSSKKIYNHKRMRIVHTGPRKGSYVIVKGKKIYLQK